MSTTTITKVSKKRKRVSTASEASVKFQAVEVEISRPGVAGPALFSTPGLEPPVSTPFQVYGRKKAKGSKKHDDEAGDKTMIAGEGPAVEFFSSFDGEGNDTGCRYIVALHKPSTGTVRLLTPTVASTSQSKTPTVIPTRLHVLSHAVKSLKSLPTPPPTALPYLEARNALGETFGTKKAKSQMRARERQKVDVDAVKGAVSHLVEGIEKGVEGLASKEEAQEAANSVRLVPPFSLTADDPNDVYPLHDTIPEPEWKALSGAVAPIIALGLGSRPKEREAALAFKRSKWVNNHLGRIVSTEGKAGLDGKDGKRSLRILYYVSALFAFRSVLQRIREGAAKEVLHEQMPGVPTIVVDGMISRFTEVVRASNLHVSTSTTQTKLMTYMLALCLRVDNWATDTTTVAHDLSMGVASLNTLFRSLGCKISVVNERDRARLGLSDASKDTKFAVLNAPLVFPKPRVGRKK
ncbi:hypothetical protein HGRIS_006751 [Hohenbuehelia grisea]|uniref:Uncharacterized protein n=1 Tax=Hohenbuehelia grisea TaxID=104357 RepID=A0ABR3JAH2_9AGAR